MSSFDSRRRMLNRWGRVMTLKRDATSVAVLGKLTHYLPQEITGAVRQGDARIAIGQAELTAAGFTTPIESPDLFEVDGRIWVVQGALPVYEGSTLVGWNCHVRGGH